MSINPLNDISKVYLEQVAAVEEGVRPTPVDKPLDKAAFKKRRRSLAGKEKSAEARKRGHVGKEWYNSGRTYSPDEAKSGRANMQDHERSTRHRSAVDPEGDDDLYSADKTKNPKKLRKQKAMGESAVPGKPAEKLGAVTLIPKAEQEAARERALAKAKAMREKRGIKTEAVKGVDPEMRKAASAERKAGDKRLSPSTGKGYADQQKQSIAYMDKLTKKNKNVVGLVTKEALDPVGHEDADVDNDGKKNTNADKYLVKRRKAIGKAISTQEAKEVKKWWDDDGDGKGYEEGEVSGKFKKKKSVKESFSNWRQDLSEVMSDVENEKKVTEKKVDNKININPKLDLGEAVENLGGTLLEMIEIDEVDYIVESVYGELLEEGYDEDDIEEALEYALTEAKVTFGHDTDKPYQHKKKSGAGQMVKAVGRLARQKLSSKVRGAKTAAKQAVATGARKVAKGALGVARKAEGSDKTPSAAHTKTRSASTYRGAGAGTKEKVSSGSYSYTPSAKKKTEKPADPWKGSSTVPQKPKPKPKPEKPSDPWEGSATTPPKAKAKPKAATKKAAAPKAKAPATTKKKRKSKLDDLLASVRSEQVIIDEKVLTAAETKERERIVKSMKSKASDFEKRYPGRGKEVMYATATKMAKKMAEQALELQPKSQSSEKPDQQQKKSQQQKDRIRQQEVQIIQRKLQALRSAPRGSDPSITA
jgi:hypothetical protein